MASDDDNRSQKRNHSEFRDDASGTAFPIV